MRRTFLIVVVVAVGALLASGCALLVPPGDAPLRYRDSVFDAVTTTSGITYGHAADQQGADVTLVLDVYRPQGDTLTSRPAVVFVHGGSFSGGTKTSPEIVDEATTLAKEGYVAFSISYRLSPHGCGTPNAECLQAITDAKHDAQTAIRWVRSHATTYGVDTTRIAVAGTSAGAITALNVVYGAEADGSASAASGQARAAVSLSGAAILTTPDPGEPPALDFHGTVDPLVPYEWTTRTADQAHAAHDHYELITWEGDGHVPYVKHRAEILADTSNFLYWTLDLAHAAA